MAKVSIIIPVYNCQSFIEETIVSVINQTEKDIEVIVVDDGSTDNTTAIVQSIASRDSRVKVLLQSNSGKPSIARNAGLRNANSEIICFLDGDDVYHPRKIEKCLKFLNEYPEINLVFHDVRYLTSDGDLNEETFLGAVGFKSKAADYLDHVGEQIFITRSKFYNFMSTTITGIHTSSVAIRKKRLMLEDIWFPEDLVIGEDIDLWFRLMKGGRAIFIDEVLSFYRQHEDNITKNIKITLIGSIDSHARNFNRAKNILSPLDMKKYKKRISSQYFYLGYYYFSTGCTEKARRSYIYGIKWFFDYKYLIAYFKTLVPSKFLRLFRR